jgi:hypothetical protein
MLSTGLTELQSSEDIMFLRVKLQLEKTDSEVRKIILKKNY